MPAFISTTEPNADNAQKAEKLLSAGKALFIGAHPDDIVLSWDPDFIYNPHPGHPKNGRYNIAKTMSSL